VSLDRRGDGAFRVFLSSTFDMGEERDVLATRVFPVLRARCEERGAQLAEIDLRWGITDEQAGRGLVISTCLHEIDACRPFFVGMIGHRYGMVREPSPTDVERFPWLHDLRDRSVLELELRYGAIRDRRPPVVPADRRAGSAVRATPLPEHRRARGAGRRPDRRGGRGGVGHRRCG
jgi:hypothetical protein